MSETIPNNILIELTWNKQTYEIPVSTDIQETGLAFKQRVQSLTGVPVERQKLLSKTTIKGVGWKGMLKDDTQLDFSTLKTTTTKKWSVTLIGSAETLIEPPTGERTKFIEDLTPAELQVAEDAKAQAALATAHGMIPALQLPPQYRDDGKQEWYTYNRLVTGLPQREIEQNLLVQTSQDGSCVLQDKTVMNLGLELRRAYINDLAVLRDGTCVSVLDDGHVQLWKHAAQQHDVVSPGVTNEGGVVSVVAMNHVSSYSPVAFATAGRGSVQLWTDNAEPIGTLPSAMPGTSPASLSYCLLNDGSNNNNNNNNTNNMITLLAARLEITRPTNPLQFHLPPQNESERQRRAMAEAQEAAIQQSLARAARSIQVWFSSSATALSVTSSSGPFLQSQILEPPDGLEYTAPITCLEILNVQHQHDTLSSTTSTFLIAGDTAGGLRVWKVQILYQANNNGSVQFHHYAYYQLVDSSSESSPLCSIVCMQVLQNGRLAISTTIREATHHQAAVVEGATPITVAASRAVHILDVSNLHSSSNSHHTPIALSTLMGHSNKDAVICMCQLPNGDLLTGGGKLDATLQLWSSTQLLQLPPEISNTSVSESESHPNRTASSPIRVESKAHKTLESVGYVFALAVLPDTKENSNYFAVATARYNTVKIII